MVAMIPLAIGTMAYPTFKELGPNFNSIKVLSENKESVVTTAVAGIGVGYFTGAITAATFAPLLPVVAGVSIGIGVGYAVSEYLTPRVENRYFPEYLSKHEIFGPVARIATTSAIGTATITCKGLATAYYLSSSVSQAFVTPNIPGIESFEGSTRIIVEDLSTLAVMGGGYGLSYVPFVASVGSKVATGLRYTTAVNAAWQFVSGVRQAYTQDESLSMDLAGTSVFLVAGYYASGNGYVLTVSGAINDFVNTDEVILMTILNNVNDRVLAKTGDAMMDTVNSDGSSALKTGIAWKAGLKKGATPYTGTKFLAASAKPAFKISPDGLEWATNTSSEFTPYARVVTTYVADAPSTLVASAEKHMFSDVAKFMNANNVPAATIKAHKFDDLSSLQTAGHLTPAQVQQVSLWQSLYNSNVVISSFTSSCFKTVGTSMGAKATKIWQANLVLPSLKRLDNKVKQYCSGGVSDFCTYLAVHALPKCVKQYAAYKITENKSLVLSDDTIAAIDDSINDLDYLDKKGEDKFCNFLEIEALRNEEGLDVGELGKIKGQDISDQFFADLSSENKTRFQKYYGQFASVTEFSKGTKLSLSFLDYGISTFSPFKKKAALPSLNMAEMALLAQADSINHHREMGNTYIFAGSVRAITTGMEDYYLPAVSRTGYSGPLKALPVVLGLGYLANEVRGKFGKVSDKNQAKKSREAKEVILRKAQDLLHKDWQELYKSHQDGAFDKDKVAKMNASGVTKSMHLCDNFNGFASGFDIDTISSTAVKEVMQEIQTGCTHVQESYDKLEHIPRDTFDKALKMLDQVVCHTFTPDVEPMDTLLSTVRACTVVKRFEGPETFACVCTKVEDAIVELRKGISSEHFDTLPVEALGNVIDVDTVS